MIKVLWSLPVDIRMQYKLIDLAHEASPVEFPLIDPNFQQIKRHMVPWADQSHVLVLTHMLSPLPRTSLSPFLTDYTSVTQLLLQNYKNSSLFPPFPVSLTLTHRLCSIVEFLYLALIIPYIYSLLTCLDLSVVYGVLVLFSVASDPRVVPGT